MIEWKAKRYFNRERRIFAQLGQHLSSISDAKTAAEIIMDVADKLLGWDACYIILYDPQQGEKPRPLMAVDIVEGKRTKIKNIAPEPVISKYAPRHCRGWIHQDSV